MTGNQGDRMRHATDGGWVVYQMPVKGVPAGVRGICQQWEWDAMELARPGVNTLIQAGIANEGEAERLARGSSGEARPRAARQTPPSWPDAAAAVVTGATDPAAE
jgi:hypothetical protein